MVSYFLNNAAKTCLYELKILENIEIEHFFQSRTFFHLSSYLHTSCSSASKIRNKTTDILGDELDNKIKETDLKICRNSQLKVIQVHNCIESYIKTKVKPAKADSLPETPHKASVTAQSNHSDLLHQSVNRKQNLILDRNHKSSKS